MNITCTREEWRILHHILDTSQDYNVQTIIHENEFIADISYVHFDKKVLILEGTFTD